MAVSRVRFGQRTKRIFSCEMSGKAFVIRMRVGMRVPEALSSSDVIAATGAEPAGEHLSRAEMERAILSLSAGEKIALSKIAAIYAAKTPVEGRDLIHESFTRALEGRRQWPRHVDTVVFLVGVVRSIADE